MTNMTIIPPSAATPDFAAGTVRADLSAGWKVDPHRGGHDGRVSSEWWHRPEDQRFLTLADLHAAVAARAAGARETTVETKLVRVNASRDDFRGLTLTLPDDEAPVHPTHWSFGQLASLVGASAKHLRRYPAAISAPALQWDLLQHRAELAKVMTAPDGRVELRAVTGPDYGRIWDHEVVEAVRKIAGDGSRWKVPGQIDWGTLTYNPNLDVTAKTTTLYASDHDVFIFLVADREPIEVGKLPDGSPDLYFRGFYVWNSETGARSVGISTFYLRAVCQNRCIWGQEGLQTVTIRHSKFAADRFAREAAPALARYANSSPAAFVTGIQAAKGLVVATNAEERLGWLEDKADLSARDARLVVETVLREEGREPESVWDMVMGLTALAREKPHTDDRLELERKAGRLLAKAA